MFCAAFFCQKVSGEKLFAYPGRHLVIHLTHLIGLDAEIDICHPGQAKRSAGIWGIPRIPCGKIGMRVWG